MPEDPLGPFRKDPEIADAECLLLNSSRSVGERIQALRVLLRLVDELPELLDALWRPIGGEPFELQQAAIRALACLMAPAARAKLRQIAAQANWAAQQEALFALASLNDAEGLNRCMFLFHHGGPEQRQAALVYLAKYKRPEVLAFFEEAWVSPKLSTDDRRIIALSLLRRGNNLGAHFLEEQFASCDSDDQVLILVALASAGSRQRLLQLQTLLDKDYGQEGPGLLKVCLREFLAQEGAEGDWLQHARTWVAERLRQA